MTPPRSGTPSSRRTRAHTASASRTWTTTGFPAARAASSSAFPNEPGARQSPTQTTRSSPAARARATTPSRSFAKSSRSRCACESMSAMLTPTSLDLDGLLDARPRRDPVTQRHHLEVRRLARGEEHPLRGDPAERARREVRDHHDALADERLRVGVCLGDPGHDGARLRVPGVHRELEELVRLLHPLRRLHHGEDRKSIRLNSSHSSISYAVFCL